MPNNAINRLAVLSTYRNLLRLHQHLPHEMREMGTVFVRNEFKSHKNASEEHARKFIKEWKVLVKYHLNDLYIMFVQMFHHVCSNTAIKVWVEYMFPPSLFD